MNWTNNLKQAPFLPEDHSILAVYFITQNSSFPKQSISWTLNIKYGVHNNIIQLFIHHTYLFLHFKLRLSDLTHNCMCCIVFLLFCTLPICIFVYCSFVVCVLSCHWHAVTLWSFCRCNIFLVCVNIPGQ